jgi:hypothetical protein
MKKTSEMGLIGKTPNTNRQTPENLQIPMGLAAKERKYR